MNFVLADWFKSIKKWPQISGAQNNEGVLVFGGDDTYLREGIRLSSWRNAGRLGLV